MSQIQKKSLKEIIAVEYQKCAKDPVYFIKKYCMIQHPKRGKIPFHLYQFQKRVLILLIKNYQMIYFGLLKKLKGEIYSKKICIILYNTVTIF